MAVVAIRAVQGDGIIGYAKNAQTGYEDAQANEQATLDGYLGTLEADKVATTMEEAQSNIMLSKTVNSTVTDKYENKIVVPAGFKILVDGTTDYTKDDIDVTKGIVIQDASGNEFVWVPVGNIKTSETDTTGTPIILGRYSWSGSTPKLVQPTDSNPYTGEVGITSDNKSSTNNDNYTEYQSTSETSNAKAKNIKDFYERATASHGYYIGRYEAGVSGYDETATNNNTQPSGEANWTKYTTAEGNNPQLVCKANQQVWGYVTQKKASELCRSMYINKPFESDLINSYTWDTAIVFIQTFGADGVDGKEVNSSSYANGNKSTGFRNTGLNPDKYRNIYDMSGNATEWSTEATNHTNFPCIGRGGYFASGDNFPCNGSSWHGHCRQASYVEKNMTFRPILYV